MKVSPARQVVLAVLALVLLVLQARLWFGEGSLRHVASLERQVEVLNAKNADCLLYTSPSPRDRTRSRMPSSA